MNKILVGLGMVAVLGLMGAGVAHAVTGTRDEGRAGEANGGRWSAEGAKIEDRAEEGNGGRWQTSEASGAGGRWAVEGVEADESRPGAEEWLSVSGVVESIEASELVLRTDAGELVEVSLGQSGYREAQGVSLVMGDAIVVEGHYEDDGTLAARSMTLVATGQTVVLRDENGRPMWAGGRRNGNAGTEPAL